MNSFYLGWIKTAGYAIGAKKALACRG